MSEKQPLSYLEEHHDFYETHPVRDVPEEKDERAAKREYERNVLGRTFLTQEGPQALEIIQRLADARMIEPINETNIQRADRFLWWREGRQDLIREIRAAITRKEEAP